VFGPRIGVTIGWTSMIYRVKYIAESWGRTMKVSSCCRVVVASFNIRYKSEDPDRRAYEKKMMPLLEKYFALYDKEQAEEKAQLCYG